MAGFKLQTFTGLNEKLSPRLLPEDVAQDTQNAFLDRGRLEALPQDTNDSSETGPSHPASHIGSTTKTIFKATNAEWFTFNDEVDIIKSPIKEDVHGRFYFTGIGGSSGFPRMTSASSGISGSGPYPTTTFRLGLPTPPAFTAGPSVNNGTAASGATESSRAYVYTEITAFGEEGPPSTVATTDIVDAANGATVTLSLPAATSGTFNISKRRILIFLVNGTSYFLTSYYYSRTGIYRYYKQS